MRILITNNTLDARTGSELYVRDLCIALMKRGHFPVAYSMQLGEVAEELRRATIPVIDDLAALTCRPDVIHGQHHLETMTAALHFPDVPVVFACHGWIPWQELPPLFPSIRRYVAVDDLCRERLLTTGGIPPEQVDVIYNFVDLERFSRREPLPARPQTALVFSNYVSLNEGRLEAIRSACRRFGIERIDVAGLSAGTSIVRPEAVLGGYDVVFAKARCALEAMATGCAVIVADRAGLGGYVSSDNVSELRRLNFGVRTMQAASITEEGVLRELARYDADDAAGVCQFIREDADMSRVVRRWLDIYTDLQAEPEPDNGQTPTEGFLAASRYLRSISPSMKAWEDAGRRAARAEGERAMLQAALSAANQQLENERCAAEVRISELEGQVESLNGALATEKVEVEALRSELQTIHISPGWRAVTHYRRLRRWLLGLEA